MRRGQTTVEYMVLIAVVSISIFAIMFPFQELFIENVDTLSEEMATGASGSLIDAGVQPQ